MTKAELISTVQASLGADATKKCAEKAVAAVLAAIQEGIQKDQKVQLVGFGTFAVKTRAAREGRNPKTDAKMQIPESKTVGFKPSSSLLG